MSSRPDISVIIPVYNKADVLPFVLRALVGQTFRGGIEYIFVDDASTDASMVAIESHMGALGAVRIIRNTENAGPSIRINQGAHVATGRYFCLLDADELLAPNAISLMLDLLLRERADLIHGKVIRSALPADQIEPEPVRETPPYSVSTAPFDMVLCTRGLVRMAWLMEADLFRTAGGCDERIFIQDEALPLRLAAKAQRMIDLQVGVTYAPRTGYHLSTDKRQQHHDRFFAYYLALREIPQLSADQRCIIGRTCLSIAWKTARSRELPNHRWTAFRAYIAATLGLPVPDSVLEQFAAVFRSMGGIRRARVIAS